MNKNVMNMEHHFIIIAKKTACSSQDLFAYNESLQHLMVCLPTKIFSYYNSSSFFDDWNIHLFQSN